MEKLITQYKAAKTQANAIKIYKHIKKHPFSLFMVKSSDHDIIREALDSIESA